MLSAQADAAPVAQAFKNLLERRRWVLWLTEVEGIAPGDAADQLGLNPNGTAQLAVRARAGLRERYLQAHVRNPARPECNSAPRSAASPSQSHLPQARSAPER